MLNDTHHHRIRSEWLAALLVIGVIAALALTYGTFNRSFTPTIPVTLTSDRSGLVMEPYAKVKMHGVQVGRVATVAGGTGQTTLQLELDPDQIQYIPANVAARIDATSVFGAKYVELITPEHPESQRISAGAVLQSQNVAVEVNTVFQNLVALIKQIDPAKLNAVLSAIADGVRGQGQRIGEATTSAKDVLVALNSRSDTLREDWRAIRDFSDTYAGAARNIIDTLSAMTTTSTTITDQSRQLESLLVNVAGMSHSGITLIGPNKDNLVASATQLAPTTALLMKYNPELTCVLVGSKVAIDTGYQDIAGGANGNSLVMDAQILLGDDPYRYPDNLPINAAKGGPGGKPGCGSLPDVAQNWPVRYLVANTGWGTGLDVRPNPGIGFPGWANYFPVTRAVPEPPSIRYSGGPAPGPIPYPGAPPYGAPQYGPDGTPLYPGVPPIPAPPAVSATPQP
ncbi:MCE family protein [Mycobacterium sp.]|uniref:MCE family protein n=1 Tax=Mycobacterium sp. TaxID=1785 RepID=UPI002CD0DF8A|nr:MCE family protein [Mycobacterium sp.]HKP41515.1 MCE family protein [Mycobacterium sp.]